MTSTNGHGAEKTADEIRKSVEKFGREVGEKAENIRLEAIKQLHNAADTIRKQVRDADVDENARQQADKLAQGLDKAAKYLNSKTVDEFSGEATKVVTANPWRAVAVVFIVGLLIGIFLRRDE